MIGFNGRRLGIHPLTVSVSLILSLAIAGCTSTGSTTSGNWAVQKEERRPFATVLIIALAPSERGRTAFEETLVNEIASTGHTRAIPSYRLGPQMAYPKISRASVLAAVEQVNAGAVLVTRIIDQSAEDGRKAGETREGGAAVQVSQSDDGSLTTVIASNHSLQVLEGARTVRVVNQLETLLYRPDSGERPVYRALTDAKYALAADSPVEMAAASFAQVLAAELRRDHVIQ